MNAASSGNNSNDNENIINDDNLWPDRVLCIMADFLINGLDEQRLERNGIKVKVKCFHGVDSLNMYDYVYDTNKCSSGEILDKLI